MYSLCISQEIILTSSDSPGFMSLSPSLGEDSATSQAWGPGNSSVLDYSASDEIPIFVSDVIIQN